MPRGGWWGGNLHSWTPFKLKFHFLFCSVVVSWCVNQEVPLSDKSQGKCQELKSCSSVASQLEYTEHEYKHVHSLLRLIGGQVEAIMQTWLKMSCSQAPIETLWPSHCHRPRVVFDLCPLEAPVGSTVRRFITEPIQLLPNRWSTWTNGYSMSWSTYKVSPTYIFYVAEAGFGLFYTVCACKNGADLLKEFKKVIFKKTKTWTRCSFSAAILPSAPGFLAGAIFNENWSSSNPSCALPFAWQYWTMATSQFVWTKDYKRILLLSTVDLIRASRREQCLTVKSLTKSFDVKPALVAFAQQLMEYLRCALCRDFLYLCANLSLEWERTTGPNHSLPNLALCSM